MKPYLKAYFSKARAFTISFGLLISILILSTLLSSNVSISSGSHRATLLLIDHSLSMTIEDVSGQNAGVRESRLDRTKKIVLSTLDKTLPIGIILYAKNPTLFSPMNSYGTQFENLILGITPEAENGGSDLATALIFAKNLYGDMELSLHIYTDGGNTSDTPLPSLPKNWDITLFGIGSPVGGKIPLGYNANGERRYKYYSGSEIVVAYNDEYMKRTANVLGAKLYALDSEIQTIDTVTAPILTPIRLSILAGLFLFLSIIFTPYGRKKVHL